jgi:hypothetical protein
LFGLLPTSLTGNIAFSEIAGYVPQPSLMVSFLLLIGWIAVVYGAGIRIAGRAYSLEKELSSAAVSIKGEGFLYKIVRYITPSNYTEKVATHFKLYFRDSNNSATSIYLLIIAYFIPMMFAWTSRGEEPGAIEYIYIVSTFMIPMFVSISLISMFYLSRDALWIWKKAPGGTDSFINSKWIQSFILSLLFLPVPAINGFLFGVQNLGLSKIVLTVALLLLANSFSVSFSMFLNILSPTKSIQGARVGINSMVSTLVILFLFLVVTIPLLQIFNYYLYVLVMAVLIPFADYALILLSKKRIEGAMDI